MNVTVHALDRYDFDAGATDEEGRLRIRRASRLAAAAVAVLVLVGCGHRTGSADAAGAPESRSGGIGEPGIRQDEDLVRKYFPELGDFDAVEWAGEVLGKGRSSVPGPSDFRVSGVVRLADADVARLSKGYAWQDEPGTPVVLGTVRPRVPVSVQWQTSEDFVTAVTQGRYSATFYADFKRKSIVFDAVNPEKKAV
ncbi:hypothetical protein [Streptomyces sp. NPDC014676]|uniref:hypothetical protein n=1 Tax=Streptomyces sp. NPDC014676 TaxID=3364879 RepID=UPI0036F5A3C7